MKRLLFQEKVVPSKLDEKTGRGGRQGAYLADQRAGVPTS